MNRRRINLISLVLIVLFFITGCKAQTATPVTSIYLPKTDNYIIDGNPVEWSKVEGYKLWANPLGDYPDSSDLEAFMKASWNQASLVLLFEIYDESFTFDTLNPWNGDAIEVFISPCRGSENILQISIIPFPGNDFFRINDYSTYTDSSKFAGEIKAFTHITGNKRTTEVEISLQNILKSDTANQKLALQVYVDDSDTGSLQKNQLVWYPVGHSYNSSFNMFEVILAEEKQTFLKGSTRLTVTDNDKLKLYVFGATPGEEVALYKNGKFLKNYIASRKSLYQPDTFDITSSGWEIENDSLFVTIGDESLPLHELFLAPRLYVNLHEKPFDREIRNFIIKDRMSFPPEHATLFIGSSSIVRWLSLKRDFPELQVIQRGFGGSTSADALLYLNQIVLPYKPAKIIYYEGDNDIPKGLSPEEICSNIKSFVDQVTFYLPETKIYILSPKPSINRMYLWEKYKKTHNLLNKLAEKYTNVDYVDVAAPMFDQNGKLKNWLFLQDGIHMNDTGYAIWAKVIRKALDLPQ